MENYKMQTDPVRLAYETPVVQLVRWEDDVLMANGSPETGTSDPWGDIDFQ